MDEIDFETDKFEDILAKDQRYNARAYALLMDVVGFLAQHNKGEHMTADDILDEFRERTLDLYGPMSYTVLSEWGLKRCEDIGEMMFNLADSHRISRDETDTPESFANGFDFMCEFEGPYGM